MFNNEIIGRIPLVEGDVQHEMVVKVIIDMDNGIFSIVLLYDGEIVGVSATVESDGSVTLSVS